MGKGPFERRLDNLAVAKSVVHDLASRHIRTLAARGIDHPAAISPKGVHELCESVVARNKRDDASKRR